MRKINLLNNTLILLTFLTIVVGNGNILAQTDSLAGEEKKAARISLDYFNMNNTEHQLVVTVKSRVEGRYENIGGVTVHLYQDIVSPEKLLASPVTENDGRAIYILPTTSDTATVHTYIVTIENDSVFEDTEKETTIQKAYIELTTEEADSIKSVKVFVGTLDAGGNRHPAAGVPVGIFIKRLFGELPVQTEVGSTDEEGFLSLEIPAGIPGDKNGDYILIGRVSDHETFGNLTISKTVPWGVPLSLNTSAQLRELWLSSSNTSEAILIITLVLLFCIFGVVIYIFRQLVKISHIGLGR